MTLLTGDTTGLRAFDDNGDPVSGALLYLFDGGTSDPAPIYIDATLTTTHPTPVVANASGVFPACHVPAGSFKLDMRTPAGASLTGFPQDRVYTYSESSYALAAAASASEAAASASSALDASAAVSGYATRVLAEAADVPADVQTISVIHNGVTCTYKRAAGSTALVTNDGAEWGPDKGAPAYLQHWGLTTYPSEAEALAAGLALSASERTAQQAALVAAFGSDDGELIIRGFIEFFDQIVANPARRISLDRGFEYDGLCASSRFNISATEMFLSGLPAVGGAEVVSFNMLVDQSAASASGLRADLIDYPVMFRQAGDFNNIGHVRLQRGMYCFAGTGAASVNNGGARIGKLELSGFVKPLSLDGALHFVDIEEVDIWPYGFASDANLLAIYSDGNNQIAEIGRMDNLKIGSLSAFQGGAMIFDTSHAGALPWQADTIRLDGSKCSLTLGRGQSQIDKCYGTETIDTSHELWKIRVTNGHHTNTACDLVGDANALIQMEGGYLKAGGRLRQNNGDRYCIIMTGGVLDVSEMQFEGLGAGHNVPLINFAGGRIIVGDLTPERFGAAGDGVTDDTAAILAAISFLAAIGGGTLYCRGTYLVTDQSVSPSTTYDRHAIQILHDNVILDGGGTGKIVLANGQDGHVIKIGALPDSDVGGVSGIQVSGCAVIGLEIDGNRANQTTPTQVYYHANGIDVSEGCSNIRIERNTIHDCQYYGIGVGRDGNTDILITGNTIYNTGADSIDCKSDGGGSFGNVVSNNTVRDYGLVDILLYAQVGIDVRQGWTVRDNHVTIPGAFKGLTGIRVLEHVNSADALTSSQGVVIKDNIIKAEVTAGTIGIHTDALKIRISGNEILDCGDGMLLLQREAVVSGDDIVGGTNGVTVGDSVYQTVGDNVTLMGVTVRGCSGDGFTAADTIENLNLIGCQSRGNNRGLVIEAGATRTYVNGGSIAANTSSDLVNGGSGTVIRNCYGLTDVG